MGVKFLVFFDQPSYVSISEEFTVLTFDLKELEAIISLQNIATQLNYYRAQQPSKSIIYIHNAVKISNPTIFCTMKRF
jgi:hypothetical protein